MSFERKTMYDNTAGNLSDAAWIADLESLDYLEGGAAISATDFPQGCPSGTLVHVDAGEVKPGKGDDMKPTGLTRYAYDPSARGVGSHGTMAIVVGGVIHVDKLPVMLPATDLPPTFTRQNDSGKAFS